MHSEPRTTPKADPLALTRGLLTHDLGRVWEDQYRSQRWSRGLALDEFFGLTAHQLFRTFFRPIADASKAEHDDVAFLRNINIYRASQGLPPQTPFWFLKEAPRHG